MEDEEHIYAERPNKTAIKREMLALRELGKQLVASPVAWLDELPLSEKLQQEVIKARGFSKGALKRQFIYLEKLLRLEDADLIRTRLDALNRPQQQDTEQFHQLEAWRDQLLTGDNALLEQLLDTFPDLERQKVRQLVRNAQKENRLKKPPRSSRALFRYLREVQSNMPPEFKS